MAIEHLRATFDTNIFVSAFLSHNPTSPTKELLQRWENDEFTLLMCDGLMEEIVEKFLERHISQEKNDGAIDHFGAIIGLD